MKREILFRGKRIDNGEWVKGFFYGINAVNDHIGYIGFVTAAKYNVIPETIGQFTGLTDKNGVKVFEGDIINHYAMSGYIIYENGMFLMSNNTNSQFCDCKQPFAYHDVTEMEVISNIHDNKDFLK